MGGLPCARNGGSVAMRDSTMAAQVLRMDHSLMSRHGLNDDFSSGIRSLSWKFLGDERGRCDRNESVHVFFGQFSLERTDLTPGIALIYERFGGP